jgi:cytochrome P450
MQVNANALTFWMILRILSTPGLIDRIREETAPFISITRSEPIFGIPEAPRLKLDMEKLINCPILRCCYFEALRIDSEAVSLRLISRDFSVTEDEKDVKAGESPATFLLKAGSYLNIPHDLHNTDPRYFDNPGKFNPAIFLVRQDGCLTVDQGTIKPYGGGHSLCKGRVFAERECLAFVASLLALWDFEPIDSRGWQIPSHVKASAVCLPASNVRVRIKLRNVG